MKRKDDHSAMQNRRVFRLKVVLNCLLVAFYALFVISEQGTGFRTTSSRLLSSQHLHAHFYSTDNNSSQRPFRARPAAVVSEVKDTSETENDDLTEIGKLNSNLSTESALALHTGKSLFLQLRHVNESLARISLVVLHHCWKSYLG